MDPPSPKLNSFGTSIRRIYFLRTVGLRVLREDGLKSFLDQTKLYLKQKRRRMDYKIWIQKNEPSEKDLETMRKDCYNFTLKPKISIIMPVWETDVRWLKLAIESVLNQVYTNWELCITDGNSNNPRLKQMLREYSLTDPRIKVKFLAQNKGISGNSNEALAMTTGEYVAFLDHDDELAPIALYEVVSLINKRPELGYIYSDEDKIDVNGVRQDDSFKPDWSPDLLTSCNYVCHLSVVKKDLLDATGEFRGEYDGAQDWDLLLRITENVKEERIGHIPKVLYHWRMIQSSVANSLAAKPWAYESAKKVLKETMHRRGMELAEISDTRWPGYCRIKYAIIGHPKVSIILTNKDSKDLEKSIGSIIEKTEYNNYDIIVPVIQAINGDDSMLVKDDPRINVIECDEHSNHLSMSNYAASKADSDYLVFLNNVSDVLSADWLTALLEHAQRTEIGAVGAKILYPDWSISHCGIIVGIGPDGIASQVYYKHPFHVGYCGVIERVRNYSAVSSDCIMIKRKIFKQAGGFDEKLDNYAGIDLCLKLREKNYLIVYTPYAKVCQIKKTEKIPEMEEIKYFKGKWENVLAKGDPYYNPNLTREKPDFSINI
jgi:O-antigen biosynthesis protein